MDSLHVRCWCRLRKVENAGEASSFLGIRSFGILWKCMVYKYAVWSLIEPKRGGWECFAQDIAETKHTADEGQ